MMGFTYELAEYVKNDSGGYEFRTVYEGDDLDRVRDMIAKSKSRCVRLYIRGGGSI